ncbi:MAG: site-2 protease family protein [Halobacteria archaeon]
MVLVWILSGFFVYWAAVIYLDSKGTLEKYNISSLGPLLMVRTLRGRDLLDRIASRSKFWRYYGNVGVFAATVVMLVSFIFTLMVGYITLRSPPQPSKFNQPKNLLVIPGLNEFLPLSMAPEIVFGLLIGMVVHEGGHGVMARAGNIKVDSMGVLLLSIVPMGAFVEPDEDEVELTTWGSRIRMFAAGVMNNFVFTVILLGILAFSLTGIAPNGAVGVSEVRAGSPAADSGVDKGDIITSIDGTNISSMEGFQRRLSNSSGETTLGIKRKTDEGFDRQEVSVNLTSGVPVIATIPDTAASSAGVKDGDVIKSVDGELVRSRKELSDVLDTMDPGDQTTLAVNRNGSIHNLTATFGSSPEGEGAFLGVQMATRLQEVGATPYDIGYPLDVLPSLNPLDWFDAVKWFQFISLPFGRFGAFFFGFDGIVLDFYHLEGFASTIGDLYWIVPNAMFWSAWINLLLGQFNCIPALPLDGGHILRELTAKAISPFAEGETRESIAGYVTVAVTFLMFGSFFLMVAGPRLLR